MAYRTLEFNELITWRESDPWFSPSVKMKIIARLAQLLITLKETDKTKPKKVKKQSIKWVKHIHCMS